jgi:hypothetical protein
MIGQDRLLLLPVQPDQNLGFAITPTVILDLDVDLIDQDGNTSYSKQYGSGPSKAVPTW